MNDLIMRFKGDSCIVSPRGLIRGWYRLARFDRLMDVTRLASALPLGAAFDGQDADRLFVGAFDPAVEDETLLRFDRRSNDWALGILTDGDAPGISWTPVGNTSGFGHNIDDGRPFWTGNFTGDGKTDILFYYPGDDNWWLGSVNDRKLEWSLVGNTIGFRHNIHDGRPFWTGDFTGDGKTDILFYYQGTDDWQLGSITAGTLTWRSVGITGKMFGHAIDDGRPFWAGDFTGDGKTDILFYYPGDDNWWLGSMGSTKLEWSHVGNTRGFGHNIFDGRPLWTADFQGVGRDQILFYFPGDFNWYLGGIADGNLSWSARPVSNTRGFGNIADGRPIWLGRFSRAYPGATDILFRHAPSGNWWLGTMENEMLTWHRVGQDSWWPDPEPPKPTQTGNPPGTKDSPPVVLDARAELFFKETTLLPDEHPSSDTDVEIRFLLYNGGTEESAKLTVRLILDGQTTTDVSVESMPPGDIQLVWWRIGKLQPGSHYVYAYADVFGQVAEFWETNNVTYHGWTVST